MNLAEALYFQYLFIQLLSDAYDYCFLTCRASVILNGLGFSTEMQKMKTRLSVISSSLFLSECFV